MQKIAIKLYGIRWYLMAFFAASWAYLMAFFFLDTSDGVKSITAGEKQGLMVFWWLALISLYLSWFSYVYSGKGKERSRWSKILMMLWPNIFVLLSLKATLKMMIAS